MKSILIIMWYNKSTLKLLMLSSILLILIIILDLNSLMAVKTEEKSIVKLGLLTCRSIPSIANLISFNFTIIELKLIKDLILINSVLIFESSVRAKSNLNIISDLNSLIAVIVVEKSTCRSISSMANLISSNFSIIKSKLIKDWILINSALIFKSSVTI